MSKIYTIYDKINDATCSPPEGPLNPPSRSAGLSPSSASAVVEDPVTKEKVVLGSCMRQAWYNMMNYPQDPGKIDPVMERKRQAGEPLARMFIYEPAKRAGLWAGEEIRFFDPVNLLSGRLDLMLEMDGELVGLESKSMSPYMDTPYIKKGRGFNRLEPRYYDLPQIMSYMQWWLQYGVKYWSIYYITRDMETSFYLFEWVGVPEGAKTPPDEAYLRCMTPESTYELPWLTWGMIRERYVELRKHLREKTLPPRDFALQYTNEYLIQLTKHANNGSQMVSISKTDAEKIQQRFRAEKKKTNSKNPADHAQYVSKGDFACNYCSYKNSCWSGMSHLPRVDLAPDDSPVAKPIVIDKSPVIRSREDII